MASTTDLGKWMLTNGGEYNPETVYEQLTMVMYENSTYITLKTVQGITPTDDHVNYQLMAKGFNPTALASVQATDTSGVLGEAGGTVSAQDLVDWVVDQAANKLLKLTDLVSVQTNDATKGVSAALAYAMNQKIEQTNSNLAGLKIIKCGKSSSTSGTFTAGESVNIIVSDSNIKESDILLSSVNISGTSANTIATRFFVEKGKITCNCISLSDEKNAYVSFWYLVVRKVQFTRNYTG